MKPLSDHLAQLSVQAKSTEERIAQAQSEAHERIEQRREQLRLETQQALDSVNQKVSQAKEDAQGRARTLKAKIDADFANLKEQAREDRAEFKAWQAGNYADDREADAIAAIDYAIATTKMAELATLDAISARARAIGQEVQADLPPVTA